MGKDEDKFRVLLAAYGGFVLGVIVAGFGLMAIL